MSSNKLLTEIQTSKINCSQHTIWRLHDINFVRSPSKCCRPVRSFIHADACLYSSTHSEQIKLQPSTARQWYRWKRRYIWIWNIVVTPLFHDNYRRFVVSKINRPVADAAWRAGFRHRPFGKWVVQNTSIKTFQKFFGYVELFVCKSFHHNFELIAPSNHSEVSFWK